MGRSNLFTGRSMYTRAKNPRCPLHRPRSTRISCHCIRSFTLLTEKQHYTILYYTTFANWHTCLPEALTAAIQYIIIRPCLPTAKSCALLLVWSSNSSVHIWIVWYATLCLLSNQMKSNAYLEWAGGVPSTRHLTRGHYCYCPRQRHQNPQDWGVESLEQENTYSNKQTKERRKAS